MQNIAGLQPLGGNLPPMVEATVFARRGGGYQLLHLVNASGHFGVTFYAPVRMSDLEVRLPCTEAPTSVTSLVTGQAYGFAVQDGTLTISIPQLRLFDAIKMVR